MGDSACLMPAFSYTSGLSNEANQANPMHALGESISFGRFKTESLSWEKWSTFSHKSYVEEAERYAQPGSVAQKKAFFEAHYKKIAAKKAAELLEQQANASNDASAKQDCEGEVGDLSIPLNSQPTHMISQVVIDDEKHVVEAPKPKAIYVANLMNDESVNQLENVGNNNVTSESELSGSPQMEKPLLERNLNSEDHEVSSLMSKKKPARSSFKSSKIPSSPAKPKALIHAKKENTTTPITRNTNKDFLDRKRSTPKSLHALISSTPRELDKFSTPAVRRIESSKVAPSFLKASKDCATPLKTPTMATMSGVPKHHPSATPISESRRARTPVDPKASEIKTTGPKWHILSAVCSKSLSACRRKLQSPSLATPFCLRTEERAARRKQKLEEKFNAKEEQKVQLQTKLKEKAETEVRKLRQSLCFKARPLPEFYKEKEKPKNMIKKTTVMHPQSHKLGTKASSTTMQGLASSLPPQTPLTKSKGSKHVFKKYN